MFSHDCLLSQRVSDHMKHFLFPLRGIHYNHILIMYCIIYNINIMVSMKGYNITSITVHVSNCQCY